MTLHSWRTLTKTPMFNVHLRKEKRKSKGKEVTTPGLELIQQEITKPKDSFWKAEGNGDDVLQTRGKKRRFGWATSRGGGIGIKAEPRMDGCRHLPANKRNRLMPETPSSLKKNGCCTLPISVKGLEFNIPKLLTEKISCCNRNTLLKIPNTDLHKELLETERERIQSLYDCRLQHHRSTTLPENTRD